MSTHGMYFPGWPKLAQTGARRRTGLSRRPAAPMIVRDMTNRILIAPGEGGPAVELHGVPAWIQELYEGSGGNKTPVHVGRGVNCRWLRRLATSVICSSPCAGSHGFNRSESRPPNHLRPTNLKWFKTAVQDQLESTCFQNAHQEVTRPTGRDFLIWRSL